MVATLDRAHALHLSGRLAEAETQYRRVLQLEPNTLGAIRGLGALAYQQGRVDEAVNFFTQSVQIQPDEAEAHANLAESLRIANRPDQALEHVRKALEINSDLPDALNTLGLLEQARGRSLEAEVVFQQAIRLRPRFCAAYVNLGVSLSSVGQFASAETALRKALELEPNNPGALTNLAQVLLEAGNAEFLAESELLLQSALANAPTCTRAINSLGNVFRLMNRFEDAVSCYLEALRIEPQFAMPCYNMGFLRQQQGRYAEASHWFEQAQRLKNDKARYFTNHGCLAAAQEHHEEAARYYRLALTHDPDFTEAHQGLGETLIELDNSAEAEICFRRAMSLAPTRPFPWLGIARLHTERGEIDASCHALREALARRPGLPQAYGQLASNLRGTLPDGDLEAILRTLKQRHLNEDTRSQLLFSLACVLDERQDYAGAAASLECANASQAAARTLRGQLEDPSQYSRFVDRIIRIFTPEFVSEARQWGGHDSRPVFVVGLPRSGTTLIEQILASHPEVHGAGELPHVRNVFEHLPQIVALPSATLLEAVALLDPDSIRLASTRYSGLLDGITPPSAVRVVDKMPSNVDLLGLIGILWPLSRVIVCHRDVRDVALSCWQTGFSSIRWANSYDHIAQRFADHQQILSHWRRTKPIDWLDICYEDLVKDVEGESRRMMNYLGLQWDENCLQFHSTPRIVKSASQLQVRRPLYERSVGRWKQYEALSPLLFHALERFGVDTSSRPDHS